jgi:hypothetical protein
MTKKRLEKMIETKMPSGRTARVFRDVETDKLVTFGGDAPKVCALESDKPLPLGQAFREFFAGMKEMNDAAREIGMSGAARAKLTLDLLSLLKKGRAK